MSKLLAPNVNFVPGSPRQMLDRDMSALRWDMGELNDRLAEYGYDGLELHWINAASHCRQLERATPDEARKLGEKWLSSHEGWRGGADPEPAFGWMRRRRLKERGSLAVKLGSAVLLPTAADSLNQLAGNEAKLGRAKPMHIVLFPDEKGDLAADRAKTKRFPNSSIQPTADVGACWGVRTVDDFVRELKQRGYRATIDSFHISRRGKIVDEKVRWRELAQALLTEGMVPEIHVSVGRTDFAGVDPERTTLSIQELRALADNGDLQNTPLGELFDMLRNYRWTGTVVVEATLPGLRAAFGELSPRAVSEIHRGITKGVREALPPA